MKNNLLFDFIVNRETSTVHVKRAFDAALALVWDAFTKPKILDQWWAPKPWLAKTKSMNFEVGGRWLYAMYGPQGEEHWTLADFTSITPKTNFKYFDAFCDSKENLIDELPRCDWNVDFVGTNKTTMVSIAIKHQNLADLEKNIELGFKEGFTMALDGLDELFSSKIMYFQQ